MVKKQDQIEKDIENIEEAVNEAASKPDATAAEKEAAGKVATIGTKIRQAYRSTKGYTGQGLAWAKRKFSELWQRAKVVLHTTFGWAKGLLGSAASAIGTAAGALLKLGERAVRAVGRGIGYVVEAASDIADKVMRVPLPNDEDRLGAHERELEGLAMQEARSRAVA